MKMCYHAVLEAQRIAIETVRDGVDMSIPDKAVRQYFARMGCEKSVLHGVGHGVGIDVHEEPRLSYKAEGPLKAGMIVTVEPGLYYPGKFGVRIEDMVLIEKQGTINLTKSDKSLIII
jgi:Xaa-Pro aminopeptidase